MKKLFLSVIFCSAFLGAFAGGGKSKTIEIKGTISDKFGNPLIGAKVWIEGTEQATYSDFEGNFTIKEAPQGNHKLHASHISFSESIALVDLSPRKASFLKLELSSK